MATGLTHGPAANRDLVQVVPEYVQEWTKAQRTCDVLGRPAAPDTLAAMDIGQVKGCKGKGKPKGYGKLHGMSGQKGKDAKGRDVKGASSQSVDVRSLGECGYRRKRRHKRAECQKRV